MYVRYRDNWTCVVCGKHIDPNSAGAKMKCTADTILIEANIHSVGTKQIVMHNVKYVMEYNIGKDYSQNTQSIY